MNDDTQRQIDELESRIEKLESLVMQLLPDDIRIPIHDMPDCIEHDLFTHDWDEYLEED